MKKNGRRESTDQVGQPWTVKSLRIGGFPIKFQLLVLVSSRGRLHPGFGLSYPRVTRSRRKKQVHKVYTRTNTSVSLFTPEFASSIPLFSSKLRFFLREKVPRLSNIRKEEGEGGEKGFLGWITSVPIFPPFSSSAPVKGSATSSSKNNVYRRRRRRRLRRRQVRTHPPTDA